MGRVGRFVAADACRYPRSARVVVRTGRGLEIGEVLAPPRDVADGGESDGQILRGMTDADELLAARLEKHRQQAFEACCRHIARMGLAATLLDIEHLFDGRGLFFYFLGEITPEVERLTEELAEVYDAEAQFRRFAQTLAEGCGPDCGTEKGGGCDSCSVCAIAVACGRAAG
jgi:cell fate regulator YaaT (PSP1 superfamily)